MPHIYNKIDRLDKDELDYLVTEIHDVFDSTRPYTTDYEIMGPLMDLEGIATRRDMEGTWIAVYSDQLGEDLKGSWNGHRGSTQLEAAARCYIARKKGVNVFIPDEFYDQ
jgi:hypothetical protein